MRAYARACSFFLRLYKVRSILTERLRYVPSHASAASLLDAPNCWDTALALAMAAAAAALFPVVLAPNKAVVAVVVDGEDGLTTMTLTWNAETSVAVMATTIEHAAAAEARDDGIFMVFGRNFSFLRFGSGSLFVLI